MISKLVSGGQTGADRAALDVALKFETDAQRVIASALQHLGPEMEVTGVSDNADCPLGYGETAAKNCWRVYFEPKLSQPSQVGGDSPYILIEKNIHRIIGRGIERGE